MKNLLLIREQLGLLWDSKVNDPSSTTSNGSGGRWIVCTSIDSPTQRLYACTSDHLLISFDLHSSKVGPPPLPQHPQHHHIAPFIPLL